jgi:hypothetical protein
MLDFNDYYFFIRHGLHGLTLIFFTPDYADVADLFFKSQFEFNGFNISMRYK